MFLLKFYTVLHYLRHMRWCHICKILMMDLGLRKAKVEKNEMKHVKSGYLSVHQYLTMNIKLSDNVTVF